jgi:hypothetical protein
MLDNLKQSLTVFENGQFVYTLIGKEGLDNIEKLLHSVKDEQIDGDFVETGIWSGGACIFARTVMNQLGIKAKVYACDSFNGLPKPNLEVYPQDDGDEHYKSEYLKVSKKDVSNNFEKFGILDNVEFVEGWFKDTMPILSKKLKNISILRLDGDMYESTIQVLEALYKKVSIGGYIIIDDYGHVNCIKAVDYFRQINNIIEPMIKVNPEIYYWRKC